MNNIYTKISSIVKRAFITLGNDDSKTVSHCHATYLDKISPLEAIYPYGFSANAPIGGMVLVFTVGGSEANLAGIPYSQQERFKGLKSGEVVIGSPTSGSYIKFLANGDIEILSKQKITVNTTSDIDVNAKGNINITTDNDLNIKAKNIKIDSDDFKLTSQTMMFTSGSFSFGFDTSGVFDGNGTFNFGAGGNYIARLGDEVIVDGKTGTITTASSNNKSN
jgi:phage gp45-like